MESLERRAVLAVTATLNTGSLLISLDAADDAASLSSDGTNYTVTGTGLGLDGVTFAIAAVDAIQVVDAAGSAANQSFAVAAGAPLVSALSVEAAVESTTISAEIQAGGGKGLTVSSAEIMLNANVATGGSQVYGGHVTIGSNLTVAGSAITFAAAVDGPQSLTVNSPGITTFGGVVGGVTALLSLTTDAGGTTSLQSVTTSGGQQYGDDVTLAGTSTTSNSAFSVAGATTLAADATVSTGSGAITFTGTVNGGYALTANSTAATLFSGVVGGTAALTSLMTNAGGSVTLPSVTTSGVQSYGDAVTLSGTLYTTSNASFGITGSTKLAANTTVSTGSGTITFAGTADGGYALTANSTGDTLFSAAVGGGTALTSLTTNVGGTTSLQSVKTSGIQQYGDNVTLAGSYITTNATFGVSGSTTLAATTTVSTGSESITFTGTVDGDFALAANSTGATVFAAAVGSGTALASLTTNAVGTTSLQSVATTGVQQYGDNVTLAGNYETDDSLFQVTGTTTLATATTVSTGTGDITFTGTVNGPYALTAQSTAATLFSAAVGGSSALVSLATDAGGTVSLKSVTTTGTQQYDDDATLNGSYTASDAAFGITTLAATTTVSTGSGAITFTGAVDGGYALVANSTGATTFVANVGDSTALASLTTNAGGSVTLQSVTTKGTQQYGDDATLAGSYTTTNAAFSVAGATTLAADATLSTGSGAITFTGTVDGGFAFVADSTSATLFSAAVGGTTPLVSLSTNVGGTVILKSVTTTGFQQYDDNATLHGSYTTTDANFGIAGTTTLAGATTVATGAGDITFTAAVNGGHSLTANSTGDTLFSAAVGGGAGTALASLATDFGGSTSLQSVKTSGIQQYGDNVTLAGSYITTNATFGVSGSTTLAATTTVSTGSESITFTGTVDGDFALAANSTGATVFAAAVGSGTALASLTTNAVGTTSLQSVATTGVQQYGDNVTLAGNYETDDSLFQVTGTTTLATATTVSTGTGDITFTGTVNGPYALTAQSTAATLFSAAVGGSSALVSLATDAGGTVSLKSVTTTGTQQYDDDATLNGSYTASDAAFGITTLAATTTVSTGSGAITFTGAVDGGYALVANSTGATTFVANVGDSTALASLTTNAGGSVTLQSVTTKGTQQYGDDATLAGSYTTTNAAFSVAGATTLAADATLSTGSGAITFTGTVDGGFAFVADSTSATLFSAAVGGTTPLVSLSTNVGGTVILKSVTTTGFQQYDDNATLHGSYTTTDANFGIAGTTTLAGATTVATGAGDITFTAAVNGGHSLTANSTGDTLFSAAVGGGAGTALASLATDFGGSTSLQSVTTKGSQQYGDDTLLMGKYTTTDSAFSAIGMTTLAGDTTVSTGTGPITFTDTVDGSYALTGNSTGATVFAAAVGSGTALASLTTNAGGTTSLQSVTTTGGQQYGDIASLSGTYATTDSAFSVVGTTLLLGDTTVSTLSGSITFTGTVDGTFALTANTSGATRFSSAAGGTLVLSSLTTDALGTVSLRSVATAGIQHYGDDFTTLNGNYTTVNNDFTVDGTTTLAGATVISTGFVDVTDFTVRVVLAATAGQTSFPVADGYTVGAIDVYLNGDKLVDGIDFTATDGTSITLTQAAVAEDVLEYFVVAIEQFAGITFTGTVDGGYSLTVNSSGATLFEANTGIGVALASLTSDAGGTLDMQSVTTRGVQQYDDNVITLNGNYTTSNAAFSVDKITMLAGDTTLSTGSGAITFTGTVDGGYAIVANSTAATLFSAAVGGSSPLVSLSTNTSGTVSLKSVTTSGFQQYDDNATLNGTYATTDSDFGVKGTTTLAGATTVATGTGTITFTNAVNGGYSLAAHTTGDTLFSAAVGGSVALASLTTNSAGTVSLKSVTTTGVQQYDDDEATLAGTYATTNSVFTVIGITTLAASTTVSTGSGTITFTNEVDGTFALVANSTGETIFADDVGGDTLLASLTTNAGGTVSLKSVTTSGVQQYGDNARLIGTYTTTDKAFAVTGTTTLDGDATVTTGGGSITFTGKVNGGHALVANSTGISLFNDAVGDTSPLVSLTTDFGGSVSLKSVTTSGVQEYGDNATLNGSYTTTNSDFSVAGTTTLAGATTVSTGTGDITYTGTVNGNYALTASSSSATLFSGVVGGSIALASLTTDSAGTVSLQSVTTGAAQQYGDNATLNGTYKTTNSNFSVGGTTTLDANTTVSTGSGNILFSGTTDGTYALIANSTGATLFNADVGSAVDAALTSLTTNAGGTVSLKSVTTSGIQQYGDNATLNGDYTTTDSTFCVVGTTILAGDTSVSTGSGAITFTCSVNGGRALAANSTGATRFVAAVGDSIALASLTTDADGTVSLRSVMTTGAQQYGDNATLNGAYTTTDSDFSIAGTTTLAGATTVSTGGGDIEFSGSVNGAYALTAHSSATTLFSAAVGGVKSLASLTTNTGGAVSLQSVTTSGAQQYGDTTASLSGTYTTTHSVFGVAGAATLAASVTVSTGTAAITFSSTVDGAFALESKSTGATTFAAAVGGSTALASLTTNAGGSTAINGGAITTDGAQNYGDPVRLGMSGVLTANDDIDFKQSIDGAKVLTIAAGAGGIFFRSAVGAATPLAGLELKSAASVTASSTIRLDGTANLAGIRDGLVIGTNVNAVTMTTAGSTISKFSGNGVVFEGGSTGSKLSGFTISSSGGDGIALVTGSYDGTIITGNTISVNTGNGVSLTGASGLQLLTNTINTNGVAGVVVSGTAADDNTIFSNSIYVNGSEGISLNLAGNNDQASPRLLSAALIGSEAVIRVRGIMRAAAGTYRVQVFSNTAADEIGFPALRSGFEGRQVLPIGASKLLYQDVVVTASGEAEFFADVRVAAMPTLAVGDWITSTATKMTSGVPASTSAFSAGVQVELPVLAAADNGTPSASSTVTPGARLYSIADKQMGVLLNVGPTIANTKNLSFDSVYGTTFATTFMGGMRAIAMDVDNDGYKDLVVAPAAIPTLSFTSNTSKLAANQIRIPGNVRSKISVGTALVLTPQFPSLLANVTRTASAVALVSGNTVITLNAALDGSTIGGRVMVNPFDSSLQKIGIFNGSPKAGLAWTSAALDVGSVFGTAYTGGFMLAAGGLTGDATGIPQVIVAPSNTTSAFNGAAAFTVAATSRGGAPVVMTTPVLKTAAVSGTITALAAGAFSTPVDSATPGAVSLAMASTSASQGKLTVFGKQGSALVQQSAVSLSLSLNRGDGMMVDVFANGASLVAGDLNGDQRFELVVGAQGSGMSNFRVIPGDVVLGGDQSLVNASLVAGVGQQFAYGTTGGRFVGSFSVRGKITQSQQENLDFWYGAPLSKASAYVGSGLNAPLHIAMGDVSGRGRTQLFAALGAYNSTTNSVNQFSFDDTAADPTKRWSRKQAFRAVGAGGTSFALGSGVNFGS